MPDVESVIKKLDDLIATVHRNEAAVTEVRLQLQDILEQIDAVTAKQKWLTEKLQWQSATELHNRKP